MLALLLAAVLGRWTPVGLREPTITVAADPVRPGRVYAGTARGLFKSEDGGSTWTLSGSRPNCGNVSNIGVDTVASQVIYAGTNSPDIDCVSPGGDGLFRSPDEARTWAALETGHPVTLVKTVSGVPGRLYVRFAQSCVPDHLFGPPDCTYRLLRSDDFGESFSAAFSGLPGSTAYSLDVDGGNPLRLWATAGGVFRSDDGGESWTAVGGPPGVPDSAIGSIAVDPRNGNVLLVATLSGNFRSVDTGAHWAAISPGTLGRITRFLFDRFRAGIVYAIVNDRDVFRSIDDGVSWTPFGVGLEGVTVISELSEGLRDRRGGRVLYAATWSGVFATDLGGPVLVVAPAAPVAVPGR